MPKVSVIIPVFNVEDYLAECLDSVINQTFRDIEIICIDDVSTDNSLNILKEYALRDARITILQNEQNSGLAFTRNRGMEQASGDYILFVDSDDYIETDLLMSVVDKADHVDMVCFDYKKKDEIWNDSDKHLFCISDGEYKARDFFLNAMNSNSIIYSAWSKLYRRDFLMKEDIRFINGIRYEDIVFNFLCMMKANTLYCIPDKKYIYRIRRNSIMTRKIDGKNITDYFYIICYLSQYYLSHQFDAELEKGIEKYIHKVYRDFLNAYRRYASANDGYELKNHMTDKNYAKLYGLVSGYESYSGEVQEHIADQIEQIRQSKHVIVYGAGDIARETIIMLDQFDVVITGIAVSDYAGNKKSLLGNKIRVISDYLDKKEDSIVIIATTARFYPDIERHLSRLGFQNYLEVF